MPIQCVSRFFLLLLAALLLVTLLLGSCAQNALSIKKGVELETLQLCINFASQIDGDEKLLYLQAMASFIDDYNGLRKKLILRSCNKGLENSLRLTIQKTRFIESEKQVLYVVVSAIGIAYPLSGGNIGFAWFAMNGTNLQLQLSSDITATNKPVYRYFSSWPYFLDLELLQKKHMQEFQKFLYSTLKELEND